MNEQIIQHGALLDTRPQSEKDKDYLHEELFSGLPVVWVEKPQNTWKLTSQRNQDGSNSCVKQSSATAVEVLTKNIISAGTYELRKNNPEGGMILADCGDIDYNQGTILESIVPSQNMDDPTMDAIKLPPLGVKISGYRTFSTITIDAIAEAIQAYGQCLLEFHSNTQEWQITPVYLGTPTTFGHCICGVDFSLVNGVKCIIAMDSAGQFSSETGLRILTEDFLLKRCFGAMYYLGIQPVSQVPTVSLTIIQQFIALLKKIGLMK